MDKQELAFLAETLGDTTREYIKEEIAQIDKRIDALRKWMACLPPSPRGEKGDPGESIVGPPGPAGKDADLEVIQGFVQSAVTKAVELIPVPKDGKDGESIVGPPGRDGKDADVDQIRGFVQSAVAKAVEAIPTPKDGKDGASIVGPAGRDGKDADVVEMRNFILSELTKAVDAFPRPKDGKNGESIVGPPGPAGKDAEVDELKTYFQSEIAKTLLLLPIPKDGIDGKDGKDGQSIKGDPGKDGESVHPDTIRLMVLEEVRKAVDAVVKPKDGDPGRDALDIEVLPAIPEKVVPRGTFAQHRGGVWRAKSTTDNSADWECLWDGFDRFVVHQSEDLRTFQFVATKSSGARLEQTFKLPVLIYRGIFEEGHTYEKGDVVTYGGSSWHCHVDSTSARPASNNADWLMMVREGRKGLDAKPETALGNGTPRVALK